MPAHKTTTWLCTVLALALCALRLVHLEADTPRGLTTWGIGEFVDEGYKTIDARNQVLYGKTQWHPGDDYSGWSSRSPLTHWPYYAAFSLFGPDLASARGVTLVYFVGLLIAFVAAMRRRIRAVLVVLGLIFLGTQHTLFFFSRLALFEIPIALCVYGFLFLLARREQLSERSIAALFALALAVATFGIKGSAPIYFAPVAVGLLLASGTRLGHELPARLLLLAIPVGICAWYFRPVWGERVDFALLEVPNRLLTGTLLHSSAPLMALGLACAFHALWVEPRRYLENPYRSCLIALVLLGPLVVSLFVDRSLRYYVPFLPASGLLALEWLQLRTWRTAPPDRTPPLAVPALLAVLTGALFCCGVAVNRHVLGAFVPGWSLPSGIPRWGIASGLLLALGGLWFRRSLLAGRSALTAVAALAVFCSVRDAAVIGRFLLAPAFQAREIARALEELLPSDATIAGDWAPLLTLGTPLRALYSNPRINPVGRFGELQPDYYVFGDLFPWVFLGQPDPREELASSGWLRQPALFQSEFAGRKVLVYRLDYGSSN